MELEEMLFMKNKASAVDADVSAVCFSSGSQHIIALPGDRDIIDVCCLVSAATLAAAPNKKLASHFSCLEEEKIECLSLNLLLLFRYSTLCVIGGG